LRFESPTDTLSPMHFPRLMRRINRVCTNRILGPLARVMPPLAVVHHVGRRTGHGYHTPVVAFRHEETFVVPMTYGRDVDWARNIVKAHGCQIEQMGRRFTVLNPRVADFKTAEAQLPGAVRATLRAANLPGYVLLDLQPEQTGGNRR
jgi:deazaflavin-dependent oxidoreductase (nitroreductase family)